MIAFRKLLICSLFFFSMYGSFTLVTLSKARARSARGVSERRNSCLRRHRLKSFQGLASPYLAAAGRQKIQPQEMRIWGLGWQNCFKEFSGTCVPLSGRSRPPKIQPQEMRIWAWQNFPRFPQGHFSLSGPSGRGIVSKNLARIPLFCRLRKLRGATEQLLKDN